MQDLPVGEQTVQTEDPQGQSPEAVSPPIPETPASSENPQTQGAEGSQIPEKFRGKTLDDVIKSYVEIEKQASRLSNENKELKSKPASNPPVAEASKVPISSQPEKSIDELFEEEWHVNPQWATARRQDRAFQQHQQQQMLSDAISWVQAADSGKVAGFEDFAELRPVIAQLAQNFSGLINPNMQNHPIVAQALYLMAKGATFSQSLEKALASKADSVKKKVVEKKNATMETGSSRGDTTIAFADLPVHEMKRLLPHKADL